MITLAYIKQYDIYIYILNCIAIKRQKLHRTIRPIKILQPYLITQIDNFFSIFCFFFFV